MLFWHFHAFCLVHVFLLSTTIISRFYLLWVFSLTIKSFNDSSSFLSMEQPCEYTLSQPSFYTPFYFFFYYPSTPQFPHLSSEQLHKWLTISLSCTNKLHCDLQDISLMLVVLICSPFFSIALWTTITRIEK